MRTVRDEPAVARPSRQQTSIEGFAARLRAHAVPVFAGTVVELARLTLDERATARDLSFVILRDPAFTARLLRVANSALVNPGSHPITTVSRAVVMLGFDAVRQIALSLSLVDQFLRGPNRARIATALAQSLFAASAAQALARRQDDGKPEEIHIAALLARFGEIAFWSSGDERTGELDRLGRLPDYSAARAEREVLGFLLSTLTAQLNQDWHISPLLDIVLKGEAATHPRARYVYYGHRLATALTSPAPRGEPLTTVFEVTRAFNLTDAQLSGLLHDVLASTRKQAEVSESTELSAALPPESALAVL